MSEATWSTTTRRRAASVPAASQAGRNSGSSVARGSALDRVGQLGQQFPLAGLGRERTRAGHHVVRGDPLQQRALEPLPAGHDEVGGVAGEQGRAGQGRPAGSAAAARVACWAARQKRPISSLVRFFSAASGAGAAVVEGGQTSRASSSSRIAVEFVRR